MRVHALFALVLCGALPAASVGTWSLGPTMPTTRQEVGVGILDGKICVVDPIAGLSDTDRLDILTPPDPRGAECVWGELIKRISLHFCCLDLWHRRSERLTAEFAENAEDLRFLGVFLSATA
jgi:hypothetical protein